MWALFTAPDSSEAVVNFEMVVAHGSDDYLVVCFRLHVARLLVLALKRVCLLELVDSRGAAYVPGETVEQRHFYLTSFSIKGITLEAE
jgi:hypothetical protein